MTPIEPAPVTTNSQIINSDDEVPTGKAPRIYSDELYQFLSSSLKCNATRVLHPAPSIRIAENDETYITECITYLQFKEVNTILCPFLYKNNKWVLLIFDNTSKQSIILDPKSNDILNDELINLCNKLNSNLNLFCRNNADSLVSFTGTVDHCLVSGRTNPSILICAYALSYINKNKELVRIDTDETIRAFTEWRSTKNNIKTINENLPIKYKLSLRRDLIRILISEANSLALNDSYASFMRHVCKVNGIQTGNPTHLT